MIGSNPTQAQLVPADVTTDIIIELTREPTRLTQSTLTQYRSSSTSLKAVRGSFQVQIEPFLRQWIRDDQYYAPTTVIFRFEPGRLPGNFKYSVQLFLLLN